MSTGTGNTASGGQEPEEPQPDREHRSARKKILEVCVSAAAAAVATELGKLAGQALAKLIGVLAP